ncbi:NAD(P)H-dependent oxidoreductase [Candidatus Woesearchaeota archaeon]|nr:NAD(P)H-dependent oxidoreductase [Candidatus Woesearchaeota archaeon]
MKTLVIYAHPDTPAHCPWILECVERWLKASKQGYELLDLYKMKYDPILHEDEHYTSGGRTVSPVNQRIQKKVAESSHFIFIYPIWWNSPPAILKGFLEKIVWPRFAFRFSKLGIPVKLLRGKKALLFTTSSSPALIFHTWFMAAGAWTVGRDALGFCGFKTRYCHFGNCKVLTEKRKMRMERKVIRRLSRFF